jgi:hypothetical protein
MNEEQITAAKLLAAEAMATREAEAKNALKEIQNELLKSPLLQERLAFEFLDLAKEYLARGLDPAAPAFHAFCFHSSISKANVSEYAKSVEGILLRCFELMGPLARASTGEGPFELALSAALTALRLVDESRFRAVLLGLKQQCADSARDHRHQILVEAEESGSERRTRFQRLGERTRLHQVLAEKSERSKLN